MRILVQWAKRNPEDWVEVDAAHWATLAKKPDRTGRPAGEGVDTRPGYINRINIQGLSPVGDHYVVEQLDEETVRLTVWSDDPAYAPVGERYGVVWTIKTVAPDLNMGGALNTRQSSVVYAEGEAFERFSRTWPDVRPWSEFQLPDESKTRHGRQLPDDAWEKSNKVVRLVGWREFTDGVDSSELVGGKIPVQRRRLPGAKKDTRYNIPLGTKTMWARDTTLANPLHAAINECELATATGAGANSSASISKGASILGWCFTSVAGYPNDADWPEGNYRCQLDVTANDYAALSVGNPGGTTTGHFARVASNLSSESQTWAQSGAAFTGTGLFLATTGTINPTAGSADDRFEVLVAGYNASSKNSSITVYLNTSDNFIDGPWTGSLTATVPDTAIAVSDSVSAAKVASALVRTAEDTVAVADVDSRSASYGRTSTDTIETADAVARPLASLRASSDTVSTTDLADRGTLVERAIGESIDAADALARAMALWRNAADTVLATSTALRSANSSRLLSAALATEDSLVVQSASLFIREVADAAIATDQTVRATATVRAPTDTLVAVDAVETGAAAVLSRSVDDTVDSADLVKRDASSVRSATEAVAASDIGVRALVAGRACTDTAIAVDGVALAMSAGRAPIDTIGTADVAVTGTAVIIARVVDDSTAVSDAASRIANSARVAADTIVAQDAIQPAIGIGRASSDALVCVDAATVVTFGGMSRSVEDAAVCTDTAVRVTDTFRPISENVVATDTCVAGKVGTVTVDVIDTGVVADTPQRSSTFERRWDDWRQRQY